MKPDQRSREQRLLDFVQLVAIGDAGPLGAQLLLQQLKEAEHGGPALWQRLNVLSHSFGYDTPNARLCGDAAQCIKDMLAALKLAQAALNTAPRFKVPSLPKQHDDSYKVASAVDAAIRAAEEGQQ